MKNEDVVQLTENGRLNFWSSKGSDRDIEAYLLNPSKVTVEELGYALKILGDDLLPLLNGLAKKGLISITPTTPTSPAQFTTRRKPKWRKENESLEDFQHSQSNYTDRVVGDMVKPIPPKGAAWRCLSCKAPNWSPITDPKKVVCTLCKAKHAVTGRHTNGELFVQQFKMR